MEKHVLMISIVPPFPDDQGNRVVTRNVMDTVISCGYQIDLILQGGYDQKKFEEHYQGHVNVFQTGLKKDFKEHVHMPLKQELQEKVRGILQNSMEDPYQEAILQELFLAANHYHPFSFLSDETVNMAVRLVKSRVYDFILCNYIYSLRAVKELKEKQNLPPVIVITHDAISRLDKQALEYGIHTEHRACSVAMEAQCLNYADIVCCITSYEQKYFKNIGVHAKCIRMEYDAYERIGELIVDETAYENKIISFFASANPLNEKGIHGFLQHCWEEILEKEQHMKLLIMGNICSKIGTKYKNVTLAGRMSEEALLENMKKSFLSINPVYLGTGLKIKSVDSICMGLPLVSFDCGIEGLEDLEEIAFLRASQWEDFTEKILLLSRDKKRWECMRLKSKEAARKRFSKEGVYREFVEEIRKIQMLE